LLDAWADIDTRERAVGIEPGAPVLVDPSGRVDPVLARFLRRSRFSRLAEGTRVSYVKDYRLFFSFLWSRGRTWLEADTDDVDDWEAWRRGSGDNPRRVSGAKWERELSALLLLYNWVAANRHIAVSPVAMHSVRTRDGSVLEVPANRPKDVVASNVKWYTPRAPCGCGMPEPGDVHPEQASRAVGSRTVIREAMYALPSEPPARSEATPGANVLGRRSSAANLEDPGFPEGWSEISGVILRLWNVDL
jgi:hypothetical protein